jgi:hypothetical protein
LPRNSAMSAFVANSLLSSSFNSIFFYTASAFACSSTSTMPVSTVFAI